MILSAAQAPRWRGAHELTDVSHFQELFWYLFRFCAVLNRSVVVSAGLSKS
jgi:hypothetical protein